jgi:GTP-binding protein
VYRSEVKIRAKAGRGGNGCISFRREKFIPTGGPDGGDGGRGGDVIFKADTSLDSLSHMRPGKVFKAEAGKPGSGGNKHGKDGQALVISLPEGTAIYYDDVSESLIADLVGAKSEVTVARGGRGGRGNQRFARSTDQAPRKSESGEEGEEVRLRLEFIPIVDVCILGGPNSGKSSLLSILTSAKPRIADYPFTTVVPVVGTFSDEDGRTITIMELPAIIPGSRDGKGFGKKWLKHIERAKVLLFVVDASTEDWREGFRMLLGEVSSLSESALEKPRIVVANKIDLIEGRHGRRRIEGDSAPVVPVSSKTGQGTGDLISEVRKLLSAVSGAQ